jgi:hypothetical protein
MAHAVVTHGPEEHAGECPVAPAADDEERCSLGSVQEHRGGVSVNNGEFDVDTGIIAKRFGNRSLKLAVGVSGEIDAYRAIRR